MIVSGVDRYVETWFDALRKAQSRLISRVYTGTDCTGGMFRVVYQVDSVSASDGTVKVTFITNMQMSTQDVGSMQLYSAYGLSDRCVNVDQIEGLRTGDGVPLSEHQFVAVFHV